MLMSIVLICTDLYRHATKGTVLVCRILKLEKMINGWP